MQKACEYHLLLRLSALVVGYHYLHILWLMGNFSFTICLNFELKWSG